MECLFSTFPNRHFVPIEVDQEVCYDVRHLLKRNTSILSLWLLFDHVLYGKVVCPTPVMLRRVRATAPNGK